MPHYLICYDITDPKRLTRLHRWLKRRALPIQYSVFLLNCDARRIDDLLAEAATFIDEKSDDLRCYRLPARGFAARLGAAVLPPGVVLTDLPAPLILEHFSTQEEHTNHESAGQQNKTQNDTTLSAESKRRVPMRKRRSQPRPLRHNSFLRLK